ncbi:hypothetical protein L1887_13131 [Cichorium endivia]|nr:hypothetical protein L1887_13131 [Cichorium endivia]
MEKLLSNWSSAVKSLPENYVIPVDSRPGDVKVPFCKYIPVVDLKTALSRGRHHAVQQVLEASLDFGFFQLINHGVDDDLMIDTMRVAKEFFDMPNEDKASLYSEDPNKKCRLFTSVEYENEKFHFWRDNLHHQCHPVDDFIHLWPQKPIRYRDVITKYSIQIGNLSTRVLELIGEGLGLEPDYFGDELTSNRIFSINDFPPCPCPSLALGLPKHFDPTLTTFVQQDDIYGLQMYRNGEWLGVEPIPNAFVVILGQQAQVISNGKITSPAHRVVTNSKDHRTTIVFAMSPKLDSIVEPAKVLIDDFNPPLYKAFQFKTFRKTFREKKDYGEEVLEDFHVKA